MKLLALTPLAGLVKPEKVRTIGVDLAKGESKSVWGIVYNPAKWPGNGKPITNFEYGHNADTAKIRAIIQDVWVDKETVEQAWPRNRFVGKLKRPGKPLQKSHLDRHIGNLTGIHNPLRS